MARGPSSTDFGFVWAPYVPVVITPTITPDDFVGRKGLMTRYGKKMVRSDFYGRVDLDGRWSVVILEDGDADGG